MRNIAAILMALFLSSCTDDPTYATQASEMKPVNSSSESGRFKIDRVQIIEDALAYGGKRGVYIIADSQDGKQYVGVSGIGISELGSHVCGKGCVRTDER